MPLLEIAKRVTFQKLIVLEIGEARADFIGGSAERFRNDELEGVLAIADATGVAGDIDDEAVGVGFQKGDFGCQFEVGTERWRIEIREAEIADAFAAGLISSGEVEVKIEGTEAADEAWREGEDGIAFAKAEEALGHARGFFGLKSAEELVGGGGGHGAGFAGEKERGQRA